MQRLALSLAAAAAAALPLTAVTLDVSTGVSLNFLPLSASIKQTPRVDAAAISSIPSSASPDTPCCYADASSSSCFAYCWRSYQERSGHPSLCSAYRQQADPGGAGKQIDRIVSVAVLYGSTPGVCSSTADAVFNCQRLQCMLGSAIQLAWMLPPELLHT